MTRTAVTSVTLSLKTPFLTLCQPVEGPPNKAMSFPVPLILDQRGRSLGGEAGCCRPLLLTWAPWWSQALARRQVGRSRWDKTGLGMAGGSDGASGAHRLLLQTTGTLGTWERHQLPREATQGNWDEAKAGALKVAWNESVRKQYPGSV